MTEPSYKYRKLLTCNVENMSSRQQVRLEEIIATYIELGVVYAVKEKVRELLKTTNLQAFGTAWGGLGGGGAGDYYAGDKVAAADVESMEGRAGGLLRDPVDQCP